MGVIRCSGGRMFSCSEDKELLRLDVEFVSDIVRVCAVNSPL